MLAKAGAKSAHANKKKWLLSGLAPALALALLLTVGHVGAASKLPNSPAAGGDLDPTFGAGGKILTDFNNNTSDEGHALALQTDGRIVVAGRGGDLTNNNGYTDFALARYNTDGSLDSSFGTGGKVTTHFSDTHFDEADAVAVQSDGKIVAGGTGFDAGNNYQDFALARYNVDGTLDTSFGNGGIVNTNVANPTGPFRAERVQGLTIASDGKIVVVGYSGDYPSGDFAVVRYNTDGSLDSSFANGGKETFDFNGSDDEAVSVVIQPDGKILIGGHASVGTAGNVDFALVRLNTDGTLDTSFGAGGGQTVDLGGGEDWGYGLVLRPDGKIVQDGFAQVYCGATCRRNTFGLVQYNPDGSLDTSFGSGGKVAPTFTGSGQAYSLARRSDGKLIAAGTYSGDFAVALFNPDGSLDTGFANGNLQTTDFGGADSASGVLFQQDGKVVAVGKGSANSSNSDFALARYIALSDNPQPTATATQVPGSCDIQFSDVQPGSPFYQYVRCLACRNVLGGYPDDTFRPQNDVTRGQLSKILAGAAGLNNPVAEGTQSFTDVRSGDPFYIYVERLSKVGAISGYTCGGANTQTGDPEPCDPLNRPYFRLNNTATRGQISKIDAISAKITDPIPAGQQSFTDVPTESPFWQYIERLSSRNIISGYSNPSKCPTGAPCFLYNDNTTRGQLSKIAANTFFPNCQTLNSPRR